MKASELIRLLKLHIETRGDLEVCLSDNPNDICGKAGYAYYKKLKSGPFGVEEERVIVIETK